MSLGGRGEGRASRWCYRRGRLRCGASRPLIRVRGGRTRIRSVAGSQGCPDARGSGDCRIRSDCRNRCLRGAEPVCVVVEEVAVAVRGASVAGGVARGERGTIWRVRGVEIKSVCGLVLDVDVLSSAGDVRVVLNLGYPANRLHQVKTRVPPRTGAGSWWLGVPLKQVRPVTHLVEEAVVVGITGGCVGASRAHCCRVSPTRWPCVRDKTLLFLEHDEDRLLTDTTGLRDLKDYCGGGFVGCACVRRAHRVCCGGPRSLAVILEADVTRPTRRHLGVQEVLDLGHRHRVGVPKECVRDDVARTELAEVCCGCRFCLRCHVYRDESGCNDRYRRHRSEEAAETTAQEVGRHPAKYKQLIEGFLCFHRVVRAKSCRRLPVNALYLRDGGWSMRM